jgi:hypothetical protein
MVFLVRGCNHALTQVLRPSDTGLSYQLEAKPSMSIDLSIFPIVVFMMDYMPQRPSTSYDYVPTKLPCDY